MENFFLCQFLDQDSKLTKSCYFFVLFKKLQDESLSVPERKREAERKYGRMNGPPVVCKFMEQYPQVLKIHATIPIMHCKIHFCGHALTVALHKLSMDKTQGFKTLCRRFDDCRDSLENGKLSTSANGLFRLSKRYFTSLHQKSCIVASLFSRIMERFCDDLREKKDLPTRLFENLDVIFCGVLQAVDYSGNCTPEFMGFLRIITSLWHLELTEWMIYYGGMTAERAEKWKTYAKKFQIIIKLVTINFCFQ